MWFSLFEKFKSKCVLLYLVFFVWSFDISLPPSFLIAFQRLKEAQMRQQPMWRKHHHWRVLKLWKAKRQLVLRITWSLVYMISICTVVDPCNLCKKSCVWFSLLRLIFVIQFFTQNVYLQPHSHAHTNIYLSHKYVIHVSHQ